MNRKIRRGCFVSDCDNEVALGEICHGAGGSGFKLQRQGELARKPVAAPDLLILIA